MTTIVLFAHNDETVPVQFQDYGKPEEKAEQHLTPRQIQKWHSRRLAYFLLHQLIEKYQLDPALLNTIKRTKSGRPYIDHPDIDFNISHSGQWVAIIFSIYPAKKIVGIDIEHPHKIRPFEKLLRYYAKEKEIAEIHDFTLFPELNLADRFYLTWCLREAILKSQGVGIIKLSAVEHHFGERLLFCDYCPQGRLFFHWQLPFYLAYFVEVGSSPVRLFQWKNGHCEELPQQTTLIYKVNTHE
ncbi:hypothetical protein A4G19_06240 [Pasteurellaceae bacterium Macca]|nr:hypothetical protein [Pasteurellaceae bacterium Macca]